MTKQRMATIIAGLLELADLVEEMPGDDEQCLTESVDLGESAVGSVLAMHESMTVEGKASPLKVDLAVIQPGWGNSRDNHFYPADMLKEESTKFAGAKMYATDHRDDEKSVRTWVSTVEECPVGFADDGAPIARAVVHKDWFAGDLRRLGEAGMLERMECSILASGTAEADFELDERKGKRVTSISDVHSVDWVTKAGAGGHALALAESEAAEEETMPDKEKELEEQEAEDVVIEEQDDAEPETGVEPEVKPETEEVQDQEEPTEEPVEEPADEEVGEAEPTALSEADVSDALDKANLPDVSRKKLAERDWPDGDVLAEAINAEIAYVAELTGAGQPVGQAKPEARLNEAERKASLEIRLDEIDQRYGLDR